MNDRAQPGHGASARAALALFDSLAPLSVEEMLGDWRGRGVPTGHPFDGVLEALGWHGKRFDGPDHAHPLVFARPGGERFSLCLLYTSPSPRD